MFLQEENKKLSMDNFIFPEKLRSKLQFLIDNPEKMPRVLCFYGNPGNGKTTFAKYLASSIAKEVHYYDSNSFKMDGTSSSAILKSINLIELFLYMSLLKVMSTLKIDHLIGHS